MEELKKVNVIPQFREIITEEQDKEFILSTVRHEGEKIGERISKVTGLSVGQIKSIVI